MSIDGAEEEEERLNNRMSPSQRLSIFERKECSFNLGEAVDEAIGEVSPLTRDCRVFEGNEFPFDLGEEIDEASGEAPLTKDCRAFEGKEFSFELGEDIDEASGEVSPLTKGGLRGVNPLGKYLLTMHILYHVSLMPCGFVSRILTQRSLLF